MVVQIHFPWLYVGPYESVLKSGPLLYDLATKKHMHTRMREKDTSSPHMNVKFSHLRNGSKNNVYTLRNGGVKGDIPLSVCDLRKMILVPPINNSRGTHDH